MDFIRRRKKIPESKRLVAKIKTLADHELCEELTVLSLVIWNVFAPSRWNKNCEEIVESDEEPIIRTKRIGTGCSSLQQQVEEEVGIPEEGK